ncbi:hypothetical protein [Dysgonomonas sp. GY617]|uniref:hypothetical protein n=1 Tax=Dysgonomonas sp. GY617 TaxID=2780420 RepID=UPI00188427A1|nr:hypothetical protein [Dysgonomonas sp. GY617]MBF0574547.1 hypothetical protein [Dysgonomonas sp. GY617]
MKTFDWKDSYITNGGIPVVGSANYFSILATTAGSGTRENPYPPNLNIPGTNQYVIISNGTFQGLYMHGTPIVIGQSMESSILDPLSSAGNYFHGKDLTFKSAKTATASYTYVRTYGKIVFSIIL